MKAKDTVMSKDQIEEVKYLVIKENPEYHDLRLLEKADVEDKAITQAQAEISFKEGIREVVEWLTLTHHYTWFPNQHSIDEWQAKLKEWELNSE